MAPTAARSRCSRSGARPTRGCSQGCGEDRRIGQPAPVWYQLDGGPGTEVLDVGAAPGTDVYSPVDGTVVSISEYVIDGKALGSRIDVRPSAAPSLIVSLSHLDPIRRWRSASPVLASSSKLGPVVDVAAVERQALAKHARSRGNNVAIEVLPRGRVPAP